MTYDTVYQAGDTVQTYTGREFNLLNPTTGMVSIIDIAHSLANIGRFNGRTRQFYSVAQHCVQLAYYAQNECNASILDCLQVLMHDAAEAYVGDMCRPLKKHMHEYRKMEHAITEVIRGWLDLSDKTIPAYLDEIDSRIATDEKLWLTGDIEGPHSSEYDLKPLGIEIYPWEPLKAEKLFLHLYQIWSLHVFGTRQYINESWWPTGVRAEVRQTTSDDPFIEDVIEVDFRGRVGRVKFRSENGMLVRDRDMPRPVPAWRWMHGDFSLHKKG